MRTKHSASIFHFFMVVISLVQQVRTNPAAEVGDGEPFQPTSTLPLSEQAHL